MIKSGILSFNSIKNEHVQTLTKFSIDTLAPIKSAIENNKPIISEARGAALNQYPLNHLNALKCNLEPFEVYTSF